MTDDKWLAADPRLEKALVFVICNLSSVILGRHACPALPKIFMNPAAMPLTS